ncbi:MFS transporter [Microvirga pudoricolor]|uniref:MFS transporter n=1 Tax=Microvirga pudoricolor TaxID=2778729 RepID=UPI00194DB67D|nr:MFS transporter [Microvirga pudoricolor]MBM6592976.1 MFS transporter [Microvirga pudoricolor]
MSSAFSLIWAVTAATTALQLANGLLQALLPLRMQAEGLSISAIGLVAAAYGLGFSTGCVIAPIFIRHVGYIRAFASLAALAAVVVLAMSQAHATWAWVALRALTGIILACVFTGTDSWISARATSSHRGRVLSFYTICTKVTLMLAPLGVALGDVRGDGLFMLVGAIFCLSLLPIAATSTEEPPAPRSVNIRIRGLFAVAPSAIVATFVIGLVNGPVMAITPVFGTSIGLNLDQAAALLFALQAGSLLLQWPLGWASDRFDRRLVIAGLAGGAGLLSLLILWTSSFAAPSVIIVSFALWGGLALCIYSVCVAHACDLVEPDQIISTISSLLFAWAAGVTIGPLIAAAAMERLGPGGLFMYTALVMLALTAFIVARMVIQTRPATKGGFVDIAPVSPATSSMSPRADKPSDPGEAPKEAKEGVSA